jgi:hypothetical protein
MVGGEYQDGHSHDRIPLCYYPNISAGSIFPLKGQGASDRPVGGVRLSYDLRRLRASFASKSGIPNEIVSRVIMRINKGKEPPAFDSHRHI